MRNDGPGGATGITVTDTLPDASFVSASPGCLRSGKGKTGGVVTCSVGSLDPGQSATLTIVISPSREGTITSTATVRANEPDADTADNTATEATTVLAR